MATAPRRSVRAQRRARPSDLVCVSGAVRRRGGRARTRATSRRRPHTPRCSQRAGERSALSVAALLPAGTAHRAGTRVARHSRRAAIDVSDGLVADLGHLCAASGVAGEIDLDAVPVAPGSTAAHGRVGRRRLRTVLHDCAAGSRAPERIAGARFGDRPHRSRQRRVVARGRSRGRVAARRIPPFPLSRKGSQSSHRRGRSEKSVRAAGDRSRQRPCADCAGHGRQSAGAADLVVPARGSAAARINSRSSSRSR